MKRTGFRRKSFEEIKAKEKEKPSLKKTPLKKKSKSEQRKLEDKLWQECRRVANIIYDGTKCFTCDKLIEGKNKQLGHFIPKASGGAALRYNIDNLRWQCYNCNINLGGNQAEFYRRLEKKEGRKYVDFLFMLKNNPPTVKAVDFYKTQLELYKIKYEN